MKKADIVRAVAQEVGLTYVKAEEAVNDILETIKETLAQGEPVVLRRFGGFEVRAKAAREGRNPKTGAYAEIEARRVVRFKAGRVFKAAVGADVDVT
jgi:integration host factor subunit alpha